MIHDTVCIVMLALYVLASGQSQLCDLVSRLSQWLETTVVGWLEMIYGREEETSCGPVQAQKDKLYHYVYVIYAQVGTITWYVGESALATMCICCVCERNASAAV